MIKSLSWIHFLGCIGWTLFWVYLATKENVFKGEALVASIACLLTTGTGVYLFFKGLNRQLSELERIRTENKILQAKLEQAKLQEQLATSKRQQ